MHRCGLATLALVLLCSISTPAHSDTRMTLEERTQMTMQGRESETTAEVTLWFGEDRAARLTSTGKMISRLDRGEAYLVNDADESYTVIALSADDRPLEGTSAKIQKTGESRQIGPWSAQGYELEIEWAPGETGTVVFWMSTGVDVDLELYHAYTESLAEAMGMDWLDAVAAVDGFPVLQEATIGVVRVTTRLISIDEMSAPAGLYEPPQGYERRE